MISGGAPHHRPDIDGLRGLSVALVILFHARIPGFEWGYLGVDIFFAISGFLITRLLVAELDSSGRIAFARFFERRARRILPALVSMLALVAPLAWWLLTPGHLVTFGNTMAAAALFGANFIYMSQPLGYFATVGDGEALVHLWTLSVEEQFYLIFPIFVWLLHRYLGRWLWLGLAAAAAASLLLRSGLHLRDPGMSFYLMPTRMWELLAGAVVATLPPLLVWFFARFATPLSIFAAALLFSVPATRWICGPSLIMNPAFAVPVVGAAALLLANTTGGSPIARLLQWRPLKALGLISFSAYLWHQPALVLARSALQRPLTFLEIAALLGFVLLIAWASWRWVEQPCRHRPASSGKVLAIAGVASIAIVAIGLILSAIVAANTPQPIRALAALRDTEIARMQACSFGNPTQQITAACTVGGSGPIAIAVHGDSHAAALFGGIAAYADKHGVRAQEFARPGCPPMLAVAGTPAHLAHCPKFSERFIAHLATQPKITMVVIAARWPYHLEGSTFDNGQPDGVEPADGTLGLDPIVARMGLETLIAKIEQMGRRVVLIYPIPEAGWQVPDRILKSTQHAWLASSELSVPLAIVDRRLSRSRAMLDAVRASPQIIRIDPQPMFCSNAAQRCFQSQELTSWYMDDDHLSPIGAARVWRLLSNGRK